MVKKITDSTARPKMERINRVNSLLKEEVAYWLLSVLGDNFGIVTIIDISTNRDLSQAKVYLEAPSDFRFEESKNFLKKNQGELRKVLGKKLELKKIPYFEFIFLNEILSKDAHSNKKNSFLDN